MLDDGLPAELAPPLRVLLGDRAPAGAAAVAESIEHRRAEIARRPESYRFKHQQTPLGTARWAEEGPEGDDAVSPRWLATHASVPRLWGVFLHMCANAIAARTVVELGAGVGISGAYLAASGSVERFQTLEGSPPLARVAAATIETVSDHASVLEGSFESELPRALAALERLPLDLTYVDGHHDRAATLQYVQALRPRLRRGSLVVLDDIRLWQGMWAAWLELASMNGVATTVDTGRFGVLVWHGDRAEPQQFDLARYTGWRRAGSARPSRTEPGPIMRWPCHPTRNRRRSSSSTS